jgi:hypothetical protein
MTTFTIAEVTGLAKRGSDEPFNVRAIVSYTGTEQTFETEAHASTQTLWGESFTFSPSERGTAVHLTFYEHPADGRDSELVAGDVDLAQGPGESSINLANGVQVRVLLASSSIAPPPEEEEEEDRTSPPARDDDEAAKELPSTGSKSPPLSKTLRPREKVSADRNREKAQLIDADYDKIHAQAYERAREEYAILLRKKAPNLLENEKKVTAAQTEAPK